MKLWCFCAIYFAFITHSIGQVQEQQVVFPTQSIHGIDGTPWASSIGNNLITGSSFWVYINPNLEAVVAKKSSNGTITTKVLVTNVQNNDNHAEFSLGVDNEGYIHIIGGQHNSSPQYYVSKNPDDISSFEFRGNDFANGGLQGAEITYQSFVRSSKGTLFVNYRSNVVPGFVTGARAIALARYDTKSKKWTMIGGKNYQLTTTTSCTPVTGDQTGLTAFVWNNSGVGDMTSLPGRCFSHAHYQGYQASIKFDQNNGMHISYNMADSINAAPGQDVSKYMTHLFYAFSPDEGNTWFKANGNQITTFPITKARGDLVHKSIPPGYVYPDTTSTPTMPNSCYTILDKDGLPIIVQFDYITNSTLMYKWSGTSWVNQTSLTNRSNRFYTDLSNKVIYNFGGSKQFQMSYDNMATFTNNVTMINPATWYVIVDDYYLTKTRNVIYYARTDANQATIMNMVVSSPDALAPAAPAGLSSSEITSTSIALNWTASPELDVARYDVYNNGTFVGSTGSTYYALTGLSPATSYSLTIKAVDGSKNHSPISMALTVSTLSLDTELPVIPAGLSASEVTGSSLKLQWNAATDNVGVVSYEIYKNDVWLASTTNTSYQVTALSGSTTYNMSVRAKDAAGNLSSPIELNVKTYGSGLVIFEPYNYIVGTTSNDPDAGINNGNGLPATNAGGTPSGTSTGLWSKYGIEAKVVEGLTYLNLATSGGAHNIANATWGTGVNPYRFMATDPFLSKRVAANGAFGVNGQSLYLSFIAKTSSSTPSAFRFALSGSRNVFIENTATGWSLNDNAAGSVPTSATLELNTATLLVVKIDFKAGAADVISLYKNPPIDGTLGSPVASLTVGADFTLGSFNTRPSVANAMTIDELRMGLSYADVTPSVVVAASSTPTPLISSGGALSFCPGDSVVLTSSQASSYQWYKDGALLIGKTDSTITASQSGNYSAVVGYANGVKKTSAATTVKAADAVKPVVSTKNITVQLDASGAATISDIAVDNGSTDNCTSASDLKFATDIKSFSCADVGTPVTVTLTVTDANGNSNTQTATLTVEDKTPPAVVTKNISVALVNGTATITAADIDNGSTDNCGITSISLDKTTFSCADLGTQTVTLTATDGSGNTSSQTATVTVTGSIPTPAIAVSRTDNTYTELDPKTIALGYGAQALTLTASNPASASSTYSWSPAAGLSNATSDSPVFSPTSAGSYTFTVNVTSESGCQASTSVTIKVIDVRCGNKNNKVLICKKEGSNKAKEGCIGVEDVASHLQNGAKLGGCSTGMLAADGSERSALDQSSLEVSSVRLTSYPNPFANQTTVSFSVPKAEQKVTLAIFDAVGNRIITLYSGKAEANVKNEFVFDSSALPTGAYFARLVTSTGSQTFKLIVAK